MRAKIPLFFFMEATFHFENVTFTSEKTFNKNLPVNEIHHKIPIIYQNSYETF